MKHTRDSIVAIICECRKNRTRVDLSKQDLSGLDLSGANLSGADLRWTDLRWTDLSGADLSGADLSGADLRWTALSGADLSGANLQGSDMRGANLDFTGHELSCKTIGITVDRRLVSQLLYHLCRMDVQDCPEWDELRNDERVIALANQSHVIPIHDMAEIKPLKRRSRNEIPFRMEPAAK